MTFNLLVDSPESGVTWVDTSLMPVSRLWLTAMGAQLNELALSLGYTTASGTLSNVKLASMVFPVATGGQDGFVKKLAGVAIATGDQARDITRTIEACRGLVNASLKEAEIERLTGQAVELVKAYWQVRENITAGITLEVEFNGFKVKVLSSN